MPLDVVCRGNVIGINKTRYGCVASGDGGQRKGRPEKPFAKEITPKSGASVVQDPCVSGSSSGSYEEIPSEHTIYR